MPDSLIIIISIVNLQVHLYSHSNPYATYIYTEMDKQMKMTTSPSIQTRHVVRFLRAHAITECVLLLTCLRVRTITH